MGWLVCLMLMFGNCMAPVISHRSFCGLMKVQIALVGDLGNKPEVSSSVLVVLSFARSAQTQESPKISCEQGKQISICRPMVIFLLCFERHSSKSA